MNKKIFITSCVIVGLGVGGMVYLSSRNQRTDGGNKQENIGDSNEDDIVKEEHDLENNTKLQNAYIDLVSRHVSGELISKNIFSSSVDGMKSSDFDGYMSVANNMYANFNAISSEYIDKESKEKLSAAYEINEFTEDNQDSVNISTLSFYQDESRETVQGIHASYDSKAEDKFVTEVGVRWVEDIELLLEDLDLDLSKEMYNMYFKLAKRVQKNGFISKEEVLEILPSIKEGSIFEEYVYSTSEGTIKFYTTGFEDGMAREIKYIDKSGVVIKSGVEGQNIGGSIVNARASISFYSDFETQKRFIESYCNYN